MKLKISKLSAMVCILLSAISVSHTITAKGNTFRTFLRNMTNEPIWIYVKSKYNNKDNKTRHDDATILLSKAGKKNPDGTYADRQIWQFRDNGWKGNLEVMNIYNYDPTKQPPTNKKAKVAYFKGFDNLKIGNYPIEIREASDKNAFICANYYGENEKCSKEITDGDYTYVTSTYGFRDRVPSTTTITPTPNQTQPMLTLQLQTLDANDSVKKIITLDKDAPLSISYFDAQNNPITVANSSLFMMANNTSNPIPAGAVKVKVNNTRVFDIKEPNTSYTIKVTAPIDTKWPENGSWRYKLS